MCALYHSDTTGYRVIYEHQRLMYTQNMSEEMSLKLKRMKRKYVFDEVMFKAVTCFEVMVCVIGN